VYVLTSIPTPSDRDTFRLSRIALLDRSLVAKIGEYMDDQKEPEVLQKLGSARSYPGLERLICAALADSDFAAQLLTDPQVALDNPHPSVLLSVAERELALRISGATDIYDFAARLHTVVQQDQARTP
jgi:hypothetical protein